jgi:D-alanine-D-alanine ligase
MRIAFTHNLQHDHDDESQAEFDRQETVDAIADALRSLGHEVIPVDVGHGSVSSLTARLEALRPDLVFNTAEGTHGRFREAFWPAIFDQLGLPFTGSDAWVCAVTLDKQLTKMLVAQAGVPTPKWVFVDHIDDLAACAGLRYPLIAKPNFEGSSKGITVKSIVENADELRALVVDLLGRYSTGLLVEEFVVGRDVVVPFLEASSPSTGGVLQPCSYRFDEKIIGQRKYTIYDYELKCVSSDAVEVEVPAPVSAATAAELTKWSRVVYDVLGMRDLGRIDWRVADDGSISFIEVNALPSLEPGAGIYLSAALAGLADTRAVLAAVVDSALRRRGIATTPTTAPEGPTKTSGPTRSRPTGLRVGLAFNLKRIVAKSAADDDAHAEYDSAATIDKLAAAIESHGHEVVRLEATPEIVTKLPQANVDLVFNLSEGQHGRGREAHVPALCELWGVPFTGSDAATMATALDKNLAKHVVAGHGVPTPRAGLFTGDEPTGAYAAFAFPVIAKPNAEGSSKGVLPRCVVDDPEALRPLVRELYARYRQPVLVEEFLPGREFTVGVLGNVDDGTIPELLPPMEIVFVDPGAKNPIYAFEDKLDWTSRIRYDKPARVDDQLRAQIEAVVVGAWRALGCRDVARFDLRCDAAGRPAFIEANPLPGMTPGWSDLVMIAESAGIDYAGLIGRVLAPAIRRLERSRAASRPPA